MTFRLSTLVDSLFVGAPLQHAPVRVAIATGIASLISLVAVLAM